MDFTDRFHQAIGYIEDHLQDTVDMTKAAGYAACSVYYFQRMFAFIAGIPLSEYIRRRRLTLAAFDLQQGSDKIIDIAARYGYESPDAFTRAFCAVHGLTPSAARQTGRSLKAYPRISFQISVKGADHMNYRIEKKAEFYLVGMTRHFKAPQESGEVTPVFWNEMFADGTWERLNRLSDGEPGGVHGYIRVTGEDAVDYSIACISSEEPLEGMERITVPAATWAIFELTGPPNCSMAEGWRQIVTQWLPTSGYTFTETGELECFPYEGNRLSDEFRCEIWIPVERQEGNR